MVRRKHIVLLLASLAFILSSCGTILDIANHYNDCSYSGCVNKAKKGSAYCAHHDYGAMKGNVDKSLEKVGRQYNTKK